MAGTTISNLAVPLNHSSNEVNSAPVITESQAAIPQRYEPGNPMADADGYVYASNVNPVDELVNMISASRSYQNNVEVMNTTKQLMVKTLDLGK